jgi:hypothetical protein
VGTITPQKIPAAAICGSVNTLTTPHNNMMKTMIIPKFFFNNVIKVFITKL